MKGFGISLSALALVLAGTNQICKTSFTGWINGIGFLALALIFAGMAYKSKP
jgi:hypothetical protein